MIEVISFDLDGTLVKTSFADSYWLEGLPKVYSKEKRVSIEEAKSTLYRDYDSIGKEKIEWYKPEYWFSRYGLKYSWKRLMEDYSHNIELFPDIISTLEKLKGKYRLIILSNAERNFIEIEIEKTGIESYFCNIFSSVSDFGMVKKERKVYDKVCSLLDIDRERMVHIGDDRIFDYEIPRSAGIKAINLDRKANDSSNYVIDSLESLPEIINRF